MEIFRLFGTVSINKAKAIADLNAVNAHASGVGSKIGSVFKTLGKVAVAAFAAASVAAVAFFGSAIKEAAAFEQAMAMVQAVTGATGQEFDDLTAKAKQLGKDTKFTMTEIASGMESLGRAGFATNEIIAAMDGVTALASSQMMDLGRASEITANLIRSFGLEAEDADRIVNVLAATAASSNTTVETLSESFKYFAPVARTFGISIEEASAFIGKLGDNGIQGTLATRTLATAMMNLSAPSEDAAAVMKQLNLEFFDAQGNFIGFVPMVRMLEDAFRDLTPEQKIAAESALFGAQAVKQMDAILAVGADTLDAYTDSLTGTNAAFDQQAIQLDTLQGQWTILKGSISLLMQTVGEGLMPVLKNFLKTTLIPMVNGWTTWLEKMGGIRGVVGHALVAIGQYIQALAEWIRGHEFLSASIDGIAEVFRGLWSFVVNVFTGDWASAWEDIKGVVSTSVGVITNLILAIWDALPIPEPIKAAVETALQKIGDGIQTALGWLLDNEEVLIGAIAGIAAAFAGIKLAGLIASLATLFSPTGLIIAGAAAVGAAIAAIVTHWDAIEKYFTETFPNAMKWAWDKIVGYFTVTLPNALRGVGTWFMNFATGVVDSIKDGLASSWSKVTQWFKNAWDGLVTALTSWMPGFIKNWLGIGEDSAKAYQDGLDAQAAAVVQAAEDLGEQTQLGYIKGLRGVAPEVEQAIEDLADNVKSVFEREMLIESPSKVFEGYGDDTGQGFVNGLLAKGKEIEDAGQRILASLASEEAQRKAEQAGETTAQTYVDSVEETLTAGADPLRDAAGETVEALADGAKDLREELAELEKALAATEVGSFEYAQALKNLQQFHEKLVAAAEYLEAQNIAVDDSLTDLIAATAQYADKQEEVKNAVEESLTPLGELIEKYGEAKKALAASEVGSYDYAEALGTIQSQSDALIDTVDFLREHNVEVDQSIWDLIETLEAQGAVTKKTAAELDRLAAEEEAAEGAARLLKEAQEAAEQAAKDHTEAIKDQVRELINLARNGIDTVIDAYEQMEEEAKQHGDAMQGIIESYGDTTEDANKTRQEKIADAELDFQRDMEDLEIDYQRKLADIDYESLEEKNEKIREIEQWYAEEQEDLKREHLRKMEDIESDYTQAIEDAVENRNEALDEEERNFAETRTTIVSIVEDLKDQAVAYLEDKAWETATDYITGLFDGMATDVGTAVGGMATEVATAATGIETSVSGIGASVTGLKSVLSGLLKAAVPLVIGLSDEVAEGVANLNQWVTENIFGQHYGAGTWQVEGAATGAFFSQPTLTPPMLVAEGGYSEALLPLSPSVYSEIGQGIASASGGDTSVSMRGMFEGAQITVRDDADIRKIARETYDLWKSRMRLDKGYAV